ncbi:MAG: GTPase Era [Acutalibacteraceae bacterium]|nr:GTPase Era [Eubacteriales bacterium]MEE3311456.1 GTPase Era [Acutalibacteraceae bacterium]
METKTAFVAIVGCPNVGKSSLLNRMLGQKVAIVSAKPQTTRTRIMGVLTQDETQLVFTDTPGYHRPKNKLGEKMVKAVIDGIDGVDAALLVVEPEKDGEEALRPAEEELLKKIKREGIPCVLVINKIDTVAEKENLAVRIAELMQLHDFAAVVPTSAVKGEGVDEVIEELTRLAQESPHFFPDDALTDQPERVIAAEIIREKMLRLLDREVPHGIAVSIEQMHEREDGSGIVDIDATIYCEKESHKGIVIGKKGAMLKKISTYAREDMEKFFDCHINLQCWVKVREGWRDREGLIHNFGLD